MNFSLQDKPCSNQMADSWFPTAVISHFYSVVYITKSYIRIGKKRGTGKAIVAAAARMLHVAYLMLKEKREYHD